MQAGNYIGALRLLHIAENFRSLGTVREQQLLKVIFNNLGCCYMQSQKWQMAARYLGNALALETETDRTASIMVNLSTVSYQMSDYQQALVQAMKAIHTLEGKDRSGKENRAYVKAFGSAAIAYEALGNRRMALLHYYRGLGVASEMLGPAHELTRSMQDRYASLAQAKDSSHPSARDKAAQRSNATVSSAQLFTPLPRPRRSFLTRKAAPLPLLSPKVLSSTPRLEARRPSPNYCSTTASSKDLGLPLAPRQKKLKSMRIRANSEKQSGLLGKSRTEGSDVEMRLHSIDDKLMNLSQKLNEYEWKSRELREIAEKDWSELITPVEEGIDRSDLRELESAVTIQRHIRGFLARRHFAYMLKTAEEARPAVHRPKKALGSGAKSRLQLLRYAMYNRH